MGVSTNLLINSKYNVKDIMILLEKGLKVKIVEDSHRGDHSFLEIDLGEENLARMYVARTTGYGGLDATVLSFGSREVTKDLLERIAEVTGGMFQPDDCEDQWKTFHPPHEGNSFWKLKRKILEEAITDGNKLYKKMFGE